MMNYSNKTFDKDYVLECFLKLNNYVKGSDYEGIDLYDGLNSRLFRNTILYKNRYFRLALIQLCKQSPINLRKLLLVPEGFNAKAGALFLLGNLNMYKQYRKKVYRIEAEKLYAGLKDILIRTENGVGWGYNFDWQAKAFFAPEGTPNTVVSVFVGKALLEYFTVFHDSEALKLSLMVAEFLLKEMILFEDDNALCFSYIPNEDAEVHNVNLMAASFLSSLAKYIVSPGLKNRIIKAVNYSMSDINTDGSFPYGILDHHRWVDNFHTAFNIESMIDVRDNLDLPDLDPVIEKVVEYYLNKLFTDEGVPKYYNNSMYPIDIHVIAETMAVFGKIKSSNIEYNKAKLTIIEHELLMLLKEFQDKKGYFYFQKNKHYWNKIPYIRWGQAWMFYGLSEFIKVYN